MEKKLKSKSRVRVEGGDLTMQTLMVIVCVTLRRGKNLVFELSFASAVKSCDGNASAACLS
jgi:hypothetical protein